jgi:hypothetical protein
VLSSHRPLDERRPSEGGGRVRQVEEVRIIMIMKSISMHLSVERYHHSQQDSSKY